MVNRARQPRVVDGIVFLNRLGRKAALKEGEADEALAGGLDAPGPAEPPGRPTDAVGAPDRLPFIEPENLINRVPPPHAGVPEGKVERRIDEVALPKGVDRVGCPRFRRSFPKESPQLFEVFLSEIVSMEGAAVGLREIMPTKQVRQPMFQ